MSEVKKLVDEVKEANVAVAQAERRLALHLEYEYGDILESLYRGRNDEPVWTRGAGSARNYVGHIQEVLKGEAASLRYDGCSIFDTALSEVLEFYKLNMDDDGDLYVEEHDFLAITSQSRTNYDISEDYVIFNVLLYSLGSPCNLARFSSRDEAVTYVNERLDNFEEGFLVLECDGGSCKIADLSGGNNE